jgi:uncharacterized protein
MPHLDFAGKLVVVTGASSGLGREIALSLALREKAHVVIAARRRERLEALKVEIESRSGSHAHVITVDLGDPEGPVRLFREATALGPVAALVNCAGITFYGPTLDAPPATFQKIVAVNQLATMNATMLFLRYFLDRGGSAGILTVTSLFAVIPAPFQNIYSASKHAVQAFMEGLSREYQDSGVTICTFAAGSMPTEMITGTGLDRRYRTGSPVYLSPVKSARYALSSFKRGKLFAVPSVRYRMLSLLARFLPKRLLLWAVAKLYLPATPRDGTPR